MDPKGSSRRDVRAIPPRARPRGARRAMSWAARRTGPPLGRWGPLTTLNKVVLPAPFGPMSPVTEPPGTSTLTSVRALIPPKRTETPSTRSMDDLAQLLGFGDLDRRGCSRRGFLVAPSLQGSVAAQHA